MNSKKRREGEEGSGGRGFRVLGGVEERREKEAVVWSIYLYFDEAEATEREGCSETGRREGEERLGLWAPSEFS